MNKFYLFYIYFVWIVTVLYIYDFNLFILSNKAVKCLWSTGKYNQMAMHWLITFMRLLFSRAAATRSLSANCLFTAISDVCVPGVISTVTLNRGGRERNNFTLIDSPINVAMLQMNKSNWN